MKLRLRIGEIAKERGFNQSQLQLKSGVTPPLLRRYWRNATSEVRLSELEKIAKALGVKPESLFVSEEEVA